MKQWKLINPRKNIRFAVIEFQWNRYYLRFGSSPFNRDGQDFKTLLAAKMWYGREVQSPKHYERAKWEEVIEQ